MAHIRYAKNCWGPFHTSLHLPAPLDYQFKLNRPVVPGGAGGTMAPPHFGRSFNPIATKGANYAYQIILAHPDFQIF